MTTNPADGHEPLHDPHGDQASGPRSSERDARERILEATARLIATGGVGAATTRAVAAAASVQAPTIYRLFGSRRGLLDAAAVRGIEAYMAGKATRPPHPDPVQDLRDGWDLHVAFGLAQPGLFAVMHGEPGSGSAQPAVEAGIEVLRRRIRAIARAGRLRVSEERALQLVHAMGTGTILTLLGQPEDARDPGLSSAAREAMVAAITGEATLAGSGHEGAAMTLRASLGKVPSLTPGERCFLGELLDRIVDGGERPTPSS